MAEESGVDVCFQALTEVDPSTVLTMKPYSTLMENTKEMDGRQIPEQKRNKKGIWKFLSCLCCFKSNIDDMSAAVATQVDTTLVLMQEDSTLVDETLIPTVEDSTQVDGSLIPTTYSSTQVDKFLIPKKEASVQVDESLDPKRDDTTQVDETLIPMQDNSTQMEMRCCETTRKTIVEQKNMMMKLVVECDQKIQFGCDKKLEEQQEKFNKELACLQMEIRVLMEEHHKHVVQLKEKHAAEKIVLVEAIRMQKAEVVFERSLRDTSAPE